ncbi:hypothetical protein [Natrinema sp. CGMCC1.2065]|uniref:hypothetical protein n=1 Tax=Natrinema sp. CGMCC1.2065 TaxID=3445767 RepID=UPI003F49DBEC
MPVTFTTDLPDVDSMALDASNAESLIANWSANLNNGEFRIELRDDDPDGDHPPYEPEATIPWDGTYQHTIQNILGGEQYSVRIRTQTDHVTGSWIAAEEITKLLASDSLSFANIGATSLDVQWTINNDFRGSHQIYRQREDYEYASETPIESGDLAGSVADDVASFSDETVAPDRPYRYQVRTLTQWQFADSGVKSTTTETIGLSDRAVPPRGWHLEVDHPSGTVLTPDPLDGAVRRPTINGFPRVEIPVPFRERWHSDAVDDAPLRVWHDGDRQPVEVLEHRRLEEGSGSKQTVLEGRGGTQLDRRVVEDVDIQPTHEFVRDLISTYTDYAYNVDNPDVDEEPVTLQAADTDLELEQAVSEAARSAIADETMPLKFVDGRIVPLQTCYVTDLTGSASNDSYVSGTADTANTGTSTGFEYTIPGEHLGVAVRQGVYTDAPDTEFVLNGETSFSWSNSDSSSPNWVDLTGLFANTPSDSSSGDLVITEASSADGNYVVDLIVFFDTRWHDPSTWDNQVHEAGGHLDDPPLYPNRLDVELGEITTPLAISEVALEVTMDNGDAAPALALRSNGTGSWNTVTDASSHSITYSELSTTAAARVSVGYDETLSARDVTPRYGYETQGVDSLSLEGVLDATPVLTNRSFDGQLIDVLREVADIGNFVFEVQADGDTRSIEWTQLGQREVTIDPEVADYSVDRQTEDVVEKAVIYGSAAQVTRQTVDVAIGSWVDLPFPDAKIVERKETIYDSSSETEFTRGEDYQIRYATVDGQPQIKALSEGALLDGQTVSIDAEVKPRGEFTEGGAGENPKTIIEDIPGLASKQMCDQYALYAVERTGDAIVDASVTVPDEEVGASLVDAIDIDRLPGDVPWEVDDISYGDGEVSIELGNGPSADDFLQGLSDRLQRNSERV